MDFKMTPVQAKKLANVGTTTFNVLKNWSESRVQQKSYEKNAQDYLTQGKRDVRDIMENAKSERGKAVADAGSSGVKVSSFADALFYNDLKANRKAAETAQDAQSDAAMALQKAKAEKKSRKYSRFSYSLGLLSDLFG